MAGVAVVAVVGLSVYRYRRRIADKKLAEELAQFAAAQGWNYGNTSDPLLAKLSSSPPFGLGDNRRVKGVYRGKIGACDFVSFGYAYEISRDTGTFDMTTTYDYMVTYIATPASDYRLEITSGKTLLDALGANDFHLESVEFNQRFRIECEPERFAYDVLNPLTMQRMLADPRSAWPLRFEHSKLMTWQYGELDARRIPGAVQYLIDTLEPVPTYAWQQHEEKE
ncbi:hypothetical protein [Mycobacterium sp. NPDC050853]|uniref:hypothetical protein n=1 Tax=Mycobacteriaceae TaxID=1762 RepID=UPI0015DD8519|nr:hypothetical protein [Mycobacteroides sp. LB1]